MHYLARGVLSDDGEAVDYFNSLKSEEQSSILEKLESLGFNTLPNVGDTIGSIRFIAESGSVAGFSDRITGEAASIRALVSDIDETGVKGDLSFRVAGKEGASEQKLLLDANNNHELTGSLDILGNLTIGAGIFHKGDTDTSLNFTDNAINFKVGNETLMQIKHKRKWITANSFVGSLTGNASTATTAATVTTAAQPAITSVGTLTTLNVSGNITASNISASGTGSFGMVGIGTTTPESKQYILQV
jgi:hypothetical protein